MSEESLQKIIKHLDSEEASDVAGSALTLSVIFQQGPPEAFTSVDGLSAKLLSLLRSNDAAIKVYFSFLIGSCVQRLGHW